MRRSPQIGPERCLELVCFLRRLGVDPLAARGPGDSSEALAPIDEALCHSSAGRPWNHERLEFLGDAVLRLAASEFLQHAQPDLAVGRRSALRAQLVSDRWLAELGQRCGLDQVWQLGAMAAGDRAGRATVLAETAEALIGGLYEAWGGPHGGLEPVHTWLEPHWQASLAIYLADPDRDNWKSALQEWSQGQGLGLPTYQCSERSQAHGDPERFHCRVNIGGRAGEPAGGRAGGPAGGKAGVKAGLAKAVAGEGLGPSRRAAEQAAAAAALQLLRPAREA